MTYYVMRPDMYADAGITKDPVAVEDGVFLLGRPIRQAMPELLMFDVDNTRELPPRHFSELTIPVWSSVLLDAIVDAGAKNIDSYPARLTNDRIKMQWNDHRAVNILGMLACADMGNSEFDILAERPTGIPYVKFDRLVLDTSLIKGLHIFRLAQDPGLVIISEQIAAALKQSKPTEGWGINLFPIDHA